MFDKVNFALVVTFVCLITACSNTNGKKVLINFSKDKSEIEITNINEAGIFQLNKNLATDSNYQKLVSVLQTPGENDSTTMEKEIEGKLVIVGEKLIFTPKQPFILGKSYLVETIINSQFASGEDIVKSDVGHRVKQDTKTLIR